jgi:hypothetical protein
MRLKMAMAAGLAALTLSSCVAVDREPSPTSPTSPTTTVPLSTTTTVPLAIALEAFRACLGGHGIDIEPITIDGQGRPRLDLVMRSIDYSDPDTVASLDDCASSLADGALDLSTAPGLAAMVMADLVEFSECVRARGVPDFPDPVSWFNGVGAPYDPEAIPYDDPDLGDALVTCRGRLAGSG